MGSAHPSACFTPLDDGTYTSHNSPQWQAGVSYAVRRSEERPGIGQGLGRRASPSRPRRLARTVAANNAAGIPERTKGTGVDGGVKIDVAGFEGVLYGYNGQGHRHDRLVSSSPLRRPGSERKSDGGYVQATYKIDKLEARLELRHVRAQAVDR